MADAAIRRDPEFISNITELWSGPRTKIQIRKDLSRTLTEKGHTIDDAYEEAVDQNLERAQAIGNYRFPSRGFFRQAFPTSSASRIQS